MKLSQLSPQVREKIKSYDWDRFIEKHESSGGWEAVLEFYDSEFMEIDGHDVLLPIDQEQHPNITILRCIPSKDGNSLTIFLKNTSYDEVYPFFSGFLAVCDRVPDEEFFIAIVYHEWFIITNSYFG